MVIALRKFDISTAFQTQSCGNTLLGANLEIDIGIAGNINPFSGMIVNLSSIKQIGSGIFKSFDHKCVKFKCNNHVEFLIRFCTVLYDLVNKKLSNEIVSLYSLRIVDGLGHSVYFTKNGLVLSIEQVNYNDEFLAKQFGKYLYEFEAKDIANVLNSLSKIAYNRNFINNECFVSMFTNLEGITRTAQLNSCELYETVSIDGKTFTIYSFRVPYTHRLNNRLLSLQENNTLYGKCNESSHGHSFCIKACLSGSYCIKKAKELLVLLYESLESPLPVTTSENIVTRIWNTYSSFNIVPFISLQETRNNCFYAIKNEDEKIWFLV